jgi:hypothetical protein
MWPALVNALTEVVAGLAARPRLTEAGRQPNRLRGAFEKVTVKFFIVVRKDRVETYMTNWMSNCMSHRYKI